MLKVNYCHECGRHVGRSSVRCWYCQAQMRREVRPERRCPYCDESIRPRAIKCHHCGEFLDGREKVTPLTRGRHVEAALEVEALELEKTDYAELAGPEVEDEPLPLIGENAAALERKRISEGRAARRREIEEGRNEETETDPGEDTDTDPGEAEAPDKPERNLPVHAPGGRTPAPPQGPPQGLERGTRAEDHPPAHSTRRDLPAPAAGRGFLARIFRPSASPPRPSGDEVIDVEVTDEESRYRICATCQTEVFAADRYCYHCGEGQQAGATREWVIQRRPKGGGMFLPFVATAALLWFFLAPTLAADRVPEGTLALSLPVSAFAALVCAGVALVRGPGLAPRVFALVLLLASLAAFAALGILPPLTGGQ